MRRKLSRRSLLKAGVIAGAGMAIGAVAPGTPKFLDVDAALAANDGDAKQLGFLYNQIKCAGCKLCEKSCKQAYNWEPGTRWRKVVDNKAEKRKDKIYLSMSCNHCADPACAKVCPVGAYTKRAKDGIVIQDSSKCVGCYYCTYACPYHAPQVGKESGAVSKCHFCYQLQDEGKKPVCVEKCPTGALAMGDMAKISRAPDAVSQVGNLPDPGMTKPSLAIIPKKR